MRRMMAVAGTVGALALAGCTTSETGTDRLAGRVQLSPAEVQSTFVNKPWRGPSGTFRFSSDSSTYTYKPFGGRLRGPWEYDMAADGTLIGWSTSYRFYRLPNGSYVYLHTRTGQILPAKPT